MNEPNVVREVAAGLARCPDLSEADYEAMEAAERKRILENLEAEEERLWNEYKTTSFRSCLANEVWEEACTKLREARAKWGDL